MGNKKAALDALESAYALDRSVSTLRLILAIHEAAEDTEAIAATSARIEAQIAEDNKKRRRNNRRRVTPVRRQPLVKRPIARRQAVRRQAPTQKPNPVNRKKSI